MELFTQCRKYKENIISNTFHIKSALAPNRPNQKRLHGFNQKNFARDIRFVQHLLLKTGLSLLCWNIPGCMYAQPRNVDYRFSSFTTINLSEVHRRRINKWTGLDGPGATQQLWRQIFPFWIGRARKGVFAEETQRRFVPFPNRSALQSLPARPDPTPFHSPSPSLSTLKLTVRLPQCPVSPPLELTTAFTLKRCYHFSAAPSCSSLLSR